MSEHLDPPEFAGFRANARAHRLAFPWCQSCGRYHWYPMPRCPHCQSASIIWRPVSGPGAIYSYTEVRHAFDKSRRDRLPYVVALVTFADAPGVHLIANILDADASLIHIGTSVEPIFPRADDPDAGVDFRLAMDTPA